MAPGSTTPDTGGNRAEEEVEEPSNTRKKSTPVSRDRATTSSPTAYPAGTLIKEVQVWELAYRAPILVVKGSTWLGVRVMDPEVASQMAGCLIMLKVICAPAPVF
jgi:hypothetical protein